MICKHGINDMPYGWASENEWNKRVYKTWKSMLERCYSEKYHERQPTYKNCSVCNKWLKLSGFVEEFKLIDNYDEQKFLSGKLCLDKDIKSNGINKCYCLEECRLVSKEKNTRQANKTRDYSSLSVKIAQYDKKTNKLIKIWNSAAVIERKLRISKGNIIACCKWYECGEDLDKWHKIRKGNPYKSSGGYIWKYYKET